MSCVSVYGVQFNAKSLDAIADIKRINELSLELSKIIAGGALVNIFLGNGEFQGSCRLKLIIMPPCFPQNPFFAFLG